MNARELRSLFEIALPEAAHAETVLEPGHMYLPSGHIRAIALDRPIVVGDRGAGKSFWLKSLVDPSRREMIGKVFDVPALLKCDVQTGFDPAATGIYPDPRVLSSLVESGIAPVDIWYAVLVQVALPDAVPATQRDWASKISWVVRSAEILTEKLRQKDAQLAKAGRTLMVAFDGLDRLDPKWGNTVNLVRGLFQAQLEFGKYRNLKTKAFIRPDLFSDPDIRRFPDASKLVSLAVKLEWDPTDLFGLMWQYLANSPDESISHEFRTFSQRKAKFEWVKAHGPVYVLADDTKFAEDRQESFFHMIAGKNMGGGTRSGNPWTWLPKHLADANGYTSPRSFLVALRSAAEDSKRRKFVGTETALHSSSIKLGVSKASAVRRRELEENLPWIGDIFGPLKGLSLPSRKQDVVARWRRSNTLQILLSKNENVPLPEKIVREDPASILLALEDMALCRALADGRVDFPDIVRVDAGMIRRGGIPVR